MNFTLQNRGGLPINWSATKTQGWMTVWTPGGTLNPGASAVIGVALNAGANALTEGIYTDVLTFTNTSNGVGNTTRPVTLTVQPPLNLVVTPESRDVGYEAGTTTFSIENTGAGAMDWQAGVASGYGWLTITSGVTGTNSGTVTVSYAANTTITPRQGSIRILAPDAIGSPKDVTINQTAGQIAMVLSGERRTERAWIIQRDYGRLRATIDNPAGVAVARYVLYRKATGGSYQAVQELLGSLLVGGVWECFDTFIDSGTTFTYQVVALDVADNVLSMSNEVTL
jgi:hypothetical protein